MNINTTEHDDVPVVRIQGNLDTNTAPSAQSHIDALLADGADRLVVDCVELDYISSSGLRVLLATAKKLRKSRGRLRICNLNEMVEEVFEIVRDLNTKERTTFLLAEQNTSMALRYADYGYILENGRVVMDGAAADLRENEDVKEFYLGVGGEGRRSFKDVKSYKRRKRWLA